MRRVILFFCLAYIVVGCSVLKKGSKVEGFAYIGDITAGNLTNGNVSLIDFDIQKIGVEVVTSTESRSLLANLKYRSGGQYLISLRSKLGVEIARIRIDEDSVFVYDRINKVLYEESNDFFLRKFGFDISLLPIVFGDILIDGGLVGETFSCSQGRSTVMSRFGDIGIEYSIDCRIRRPTDVLINDFSASALSVGLSDYLGVGDYYFPADVYVNASHYGYKVFLDYANIVVNPATDLIFKIPDEVDRQILY